MNAVTFLLVVAFVIYLFTGIYALWQSPRSWFHRIFFLSCLGFAVWALSVVGELTAPDKAAAWTWWRIGGLGWATFPSLGIHWFLLMAQQGRLIASPWVLALVYAPAAFFLVSPCIGATTIVTDFVPGRFGWDEVPAAHSPWFAAYVAYYAIFIGAGFLALWHRGRTTGSRRERCQVRVIMGCSLAAFSLGTVSDIVLPLVHIQGLPTSTAPLFLLFWSTGVWYAIVRYKFLALTAELFSGAIMPSLNDSLVLVDAAGMIAGVNRATEAVTNRRERELVGRPVMDLVLDMDESPLDLRGRASASADALFVAGDGGRIPVNLSVSVLVDEYGDYRGTALIGRDMRETRRLQDQVVQSEKMSAIGQLAGGVAHDFNNIMTTVLGYAELVLDRLAPDDRNRRDVVEIRKAGERAVALTRKLLAFGRRQMIQPRIMNLNGVLREMEYMLRQTLGERIEIRMRLDPALGLVKADPGQVDQVILNLVVNARDAMPDGGILTVETGNIRAGGGDGEWSAPAGTGEWIRLSVGDTGSGIAPGIQARIFEPFFTTKEQGKGTGLGLATVHGIVHQSGGDIRVVSAPGRGTTFDVFLPRAEDMADSPAESAAAARARGGAETILLAEDEASLRGLMTEVLEVNGYRVLSAGDAGRAWELARTQTGPVHLLVTDLMMPGQSGRELAERLRPERPGMRVLYISGYSDDVVIRQGILVDGVSFLEKPFTVEILVARVRELLDAPSPGPASAPTV